MQGLGPQPGGEAAVGHRLRVETTLPVGLSAVGECSPGMVQYCRPELRVVPECT